MKASISNHRRIKTGLLSLLFLAVFLGGCGEEQGTPPVLTGFQTESDRFRPAFNRTQFELKGSVHFSDPDGDVFLLRAWKRDCGVGDEVYLEWYKDDIYGATKGSIPFLIPFSAECPAGEYTANLYLLDLGGNSSNEARVTFRVCDGFPCQ